MLAIWGPLLPLNPTLPLPLPGCGPRDGHSWTRCAAAAVALGAGEHWPALPAGLCEPSWRRCAGGGAAPPDGALRGLHPAQGLQAGGAVLWGLQVRRGSNV